jgi:hypothetical protein
MMTNFYIEKRKVLRVISRLFKEADPAAENVLVHENQRANELNSQLIGAIQLH